MFILLFDFSVCVCSLPPQAAVSVKRKFEFSKERQDTPPPPAKKHTPPAKPITQNAEHTLTSTSTKTGL